MKRSGTDFDERNSRPRSREDRMRTMMRRSASMRGEKYGIGGREKTGGRAPRRIPMPAFNLPDLGDDG